MRKKYKVEYKYGGKDEFVIVKSRNLVNALKTFLECVGIDPEIEGISPYTVYDEIQEERIRQVTEEGYFSEHDDKLTHGELVAAAAAYALPEMLGKMLWPFKNPIKKKDTRSNLIRAAALLVAEIERLERLNEKKTPQKGVLETDSFIFRLSKDFKEFDLKVIIEHKVLESGETVTDVMTGKDDFIPEKFRDFHCYSLTWKRGLKVNIHELAECLLSDYFRDYYVLYENEWVPTVSLKQNIYCCYSF